MPRQRTTSFRASATIVYALATVAQNVRGICVFTLQPTLFTAALPDSFKLEDV
jgi:hypothetical protein